MIALCESTDRCQQGGGRTASIEPRSARRHTRPRTQWDHFAADSQSAPSERSRHPDLALCQSTRESKKGDLLYFNLIPELPLNLLSRPQDHVPIVFMKHHVKRQRNLCQQTGRRVHTCFLPLANYIQGEHKSQVIGLCFCSLLVLLNQTVSQVSAQSCKTSLTRFLSLSNALSGRDSGDSVHKAKRGERMGVGDNNRRKVDRLKFGSSISCKLFFIFITVL